MEREVDAWFIGVSDAAFYVQLLECCVGILPRITR